MFNRLKSLFAPVEAENPVVLEPKLAAAALFVHLVAIDGVVSEEEREMLGAVLSDHYGLEKQELAHLIEQAQHQNAEAVDFYRFTSVLKRLETSERSDIISMMWDIVFADGVNHEMEDNMVWRIAELIGVEARERTMLRAERRKMAGL